MIAVVKQLLIKTFLMILFLVCLNLLELRFMGFLFLFFLKEFLEGFLHRSHYSVVKVSIVIVVSCMAFHFIIQ